MKINVERFFNIRQNADFDKARSEITDNITIRGYNFWILICSTILASIGLDTNSAAIIIGAMLISPLMSPILGVGLAVAIHDRRLFAYSFYNLASSVLISLLASIIYFYLSPLAEPTPELEARTFPTLLDVGVALFGGIAGIVSISRNKQTNAIPGVAIATALMPPLCTAGFGIATKNWDYFFGAFYLFFINAIFISMATYLISRYLKFPEKPFTDPKVTLQYRRWFVIISVLALTPSIYFLYTVYKKAAINKDISTYLINPIQKDGNEILKWETKDVDSLYLIKVYYSGMQITDSMKKVFDTTLARHGMKRYRFTPMRVNLTKEEVNQLTSETTKKIIEDLHLQEFKENILLLKNSDTLSFAQLYDESKIAFPFIDTLINGWVMQPGLKNKIDTLPIIFYSLNSNINNDTKNQLYKYFLKRSKADTLIMVERQ
jgi:uncharacterized hydrophobic protein (TIGR00271 family)